jgi:D-serine deaminase-like pyridoxal phosphate-dependent protein
MSNATATPAAEPRCADCGHGTLAHNAIGGACIKCDCGHFRTGASSVTALADAAKRLALALAEVAAARRLLDGVIADPDSGLSDSDLFSAADMLSSVPAEAAVAELQRLCAVITAAVKAA